MGRKRKAPAPPAQLEEMLSRGMCYYCARDFDDNKVLIDHQKAKHFKCLRCNRRLNTAGGLAVHMQQVHKEQLTKVDNAVEGREKLDIEIFGMEGVPPEVIAKWRQDIIDGYYKEQAEAQAKSGNPPPGTQSGGGSKKQKIQEDPSSVKARLAEHRARKAAEKLGLPSGEDTPTDTPTPQDTTTENDAIASQPTPAAPNVESPASTVGLSATPVVLAYNPQGVSSQHIGQPSQWQPALRFAYQHASTLTPSQTIPSRPVAGIPSQPVPRRPVSQLPPKNHGIPFQISNAHVSHLPMPNHVAQPTQASQPTQLPLSVEGTRDHDLTKIFAIAHTRPPVGPANEHLNPVRRTSNGSTPFSAPSPAPPLPSYQSTNHTWSSASHMPQGVVRPQQGLTASSRHNSLPQAPGLPQRPAFDTPNMSREDMIRIHTGQPMQQQYTPVAINSFQASPDVSTERPKISADDVDELINEVIAKSEQQNRKPSQSLPNRDTQEIGAKDNAAQEKNSQENVVAPTNTANDPQKKKTVKYLYNSETLCPEEKMAKLAKYSYVPEQKTETIRGQADGDAVTGSVDNAIAVN